MKNLPATAITGLVLAILLLSGCGQSATIDSESVDSPSAQQTDTTESADGETDGTPMVVAGSPDASQSAALVLYADPADTVEAHSEPSNDAPVVATVQSRTGQPPAFLAVESFDHYESQLAGNEPEWVEVLLPVRPNGQTGWIPMDSVDPYRNGYTVEIDVGDFLLTVAKDGETLVETEVAVGQDDTPTPLGQFYLIELIESNDPDGVYGPFAFGLSGYSDTLDSFGTGQGVIGIHGTNQPDALGSFVSHGCIRVANDVIAELAAVLPLGTPVNIHV